MEVGPVYVLVALLSVKPPAVPPLSIPPAWWRLIPPVPETRPLKLTLLLAPGIDLGDAAAVRRVQRRRAGELQAGEASEIGVVEDIERELANVPAVGELFNRVP